MKFYLVLALIYVNPSIAQIIGFNSLPITRVKQNEPYTYHFKINGAKSKNVKVDIPHWLNYDKKKLEISGKTPQVGQYLVSISIEMRDTTLVQSYMLTVFNERTKNILLLGNSITNGSPGHNSYRKPLWTMLHDNHYNFDFIGSWNGLKKAGDVPGVFDTDHDGHAGWTTHDILLPPAWDSVRGNLNRWLQYYIPDVVLIELGTNDVFQCISPDSSINNLSHIVGCIRKKNPNAVFLLGAIPPLGDRWAREDLCKKGRTYSEDVLLFNKALSTFASVHNTNQSHVKFVDHYVRMDAVYHLYDSIHPNDKGEAIMAWQWFSALQPYLSKLPKTP